MAQLTTDEIEVAAKAADGYPVGFGRCFYAGEYAGSCIGGGAAGPAPTVRAFRGYIAPCFAETWQAQHDICETLGLDNHAYCDLLDTDPPEVARLLRAAAAERSRR